MTYAELILIPTFEERREALRRRQQIGDETFGWSRYLNQAFYNSGEWKRVRRKVILRDLSKDLGIGEELFKGDIIVHHIEPIGPDDFMEGSFKLLSPDNLITVSKYTHRFIHYGTAPEYKEWQPRRPHDTTPWR